MTDPPTSAYERGRAAGVREGLEMARAEAREHLAKERADEAEGLDRGLTEGAMIARGCQVAIERIIEDLEEIATQPKPPSPWRRIPETPTPGVAPFDGRKILVWDSRRADPVVAKYGLGLARFYAPDSLWRQVHDCADYWMPLPHPEPPPDLEDGDGD